METEQPRILISALQHYSYCPRQCGLIHVESVFDENVFTLRGSRMHERADEPTTRTEGGARVERALPLWSDRLGLVGLADVVEFHPDGRVVPIEYKLGERPVSIHDDIQLCAQAFCLEEMLGVTIRAGAVFTGKNRRRREVAIGSDLREHTRDTIDAVRTLVLSSGPLPPALNDRRCRDCSLLDACVPATVKAARSKAHRWVFTVPGDDEIGGDD